MKPELVQKGLMLDKKRRGSGAESVHETGGKVREQPSMETTNDGIGRSRIRKT